MAASFHDLLSQNEFWAFLFALGWMLFNWPLIKLAKGFTLMGMPAILAYIFLIWLIFILILYLFDRGNSD